MSEGEKIVRVKLISHEQLDGLFKQLEEHHTFALGRFKVAMPVAILLNDFLLLKNRQSMETNENHKYIFSKVSKMLSCMYQTALLLRELPQEGSGGYSSDFYRKHMVVSPLEWRGKSAQEILSFHTSLLLQICRYFGSESLTAELTRLPLVNRELAEKSEEKNHIAGGSIISSSMEELKSELGLDHA